MRSELLGGWSRPAVVALLSLWAGYLPAQQPPVTPDQRVALVYDDRTVPDADRAKLFSLLANTSPQSEWLTVALDRPTDLRKVVDLYYDYYPKGAYSAPQTAQTLVELIRNANQVGLIAPAGELKMPPAPVRARGFFRGDGLRVFNLERYGYATGQKASAAKLEPESTIGVASTIGEVRDASLTTIVLPGMPAEAAEALVRKLPGSVSRLAAPPSQTDPDAVAIGMVSVELLLSPDVACRSVRDTLDRSPFRDAQTKRVQTAFDQHRKELTDLATRFPLVLLDIGFDGRHGAKVRQAAAEVLAELGASDLAGKVAAIDLYPVDGAAKDLLTTTLAAYQRSNRDPGNRPEAFKDAQKWIDDSSKAQPAGLSVYIPELIVRALFWKYVTTRTVVNMSFRFRSEATAVLLRDLARGQESFALQAVGNNVEPIRPGWVPQDAIMAWPSFVNITYGSEEGQLGAEFSPPASGARVPLLAPGCGFGGITDAGASLASPYVAAAVWLRFLLDEVEQKHSFLPATYARDLLAATRPIPSLGHPVESGGMFDAPMLVASPPAARFVVRRDGTVAAVPKVKLDYDCQLPDGAGAGDLAIRSAQGNGALAVYRGSDGNFYLWTRFVPPGPLPRGDSSGSCRLREFSFDAGEGFAYDRSRLRQFYQEIAFVVW